MFFRYPGQAAVGGLFHVEFNSDQFRQRGGVKRPFGLTRQCPAPAKRQCAPERGAPNCPRSRRHPTLAPTAEGRGVAVDSRQPAPVQHSALGQAQGTPRSYLEAQASARGLAARRWFIRGAWPLPDCVAQGTTAHRCLRGRITPMRSPPPSGRTSRSWRNPPPVGVRRRVQLALPAMEPQAAEPRRRWSGDSILFSTGFFENEKGTHGLGRSRGRETSAQSILFVRAPRDVVGITASDSAPCDAGSRRSVRTLEPSPHSVRAGPLITSTHAVPTVRSNVARTRSPTCAFRASNDRPQPHAQS